jgi:hypothetical protein
MDSILQLVFLFGSCGFNSVINTTYILKCRISNFKSILQCRPESKTLAYKLDLLQVNTKYISWHLTVDKGFFWN